MRVSLLRGALLTALLAAACGDKGSDDSTGDFSGNPGVGPLPGSTGSGGTAAGTTGGAGGALGGTGMTTTPGAPTGLPPEKEIDVPFEAPQAGRTTVYVPNPSTNRVAAVNASSFEIETLASGLAPTYAATVPGQDVAIVLNVGSKDASILRTINGKTSVKRIPIGHDQNAIAVAPDGLHALVYFDARLSNKLAQSLQDVSVINLAPGKEASRGVSVGFRPSGVQFSRDNQRAFVVTEDGISIIDLAAADNGPTIANLVSVGDQVGDAISVDVQVAPDGSVAIARREGDAHLRLINLETRAIQTLSLDSLQAPAPPDPPVLDAGVDAGDAGLDAALADAAFSDAAASDAGGDGGDAGSPYPLPYGMLELSDLDLTPDGKYALAVVRNAAALLRIPVPAGFSDPKQISVLHLDVPLLGSVSLSKQGNVAALYSSVAPIEALAIVELKDSFAQRSVRLRKSVRAVALADDGSRALVLHQKVGGIPTNTTDDELRIDASEGYSLIEVPRGIAKLQLTKVAPREGDILVTPDATHLFMLLRDTAAKVGSVEVADLRSFQVTTQPLAKPPSSLGLVPGAKRLFVGQESEGGMITFLDVESGDIVHAVSGFELSGRVRQ